MKLREVRGGCIVSDNSSENKPEIILIGTGTELSLCEGTAKILKARRPKGEGGFSSMLVAL